ncbi:BTAD domain-containing putative transcriptional regulator [Acrocarpospora sp. B8E8]
MNYAILGRLTVHRDGVPVDIGGRRQQVILGLLLLADGTPVPSDQIVDAIWGTPPRTARTQIQICVGNLRKALGPVIETLPGAYRLNLGHDRLDAHVFDSLVVQAGHAPDPQKAADILRTALQEWRGEPFAHLDSAPLAAAAHRYTERRLLAWERRFDLELELGHHHEIIDELTDLTARNPLREHLTAQLMTALYRSGRRPEALDTYLHAQRHLDDTLGLDPGAELRDLHLSILNEDPTLSPHPPAHLPGLPAPTPGTLVGRTGDLTTIAALLAAHRLVTLIGPPGVGKTRLALEAASAADPPAGVGVIWLGSVETPDSVAPALLTALGAPGDPHGDPLTGVTRWLGRRRALLLLDNCEHLIAEVRRVIAALLTACPNLRVLATSRELLGLGDERVHLLRPLDVPATDTPEAVAASGAGRLFLARARQIDPEFEVPAADVARVCRAVDGLPLAIELAVGRLRAFSAAQVADRLDHQLDLLASTRTGPRHRSLRAAVDWSHVLLSETERLVFARLAVFRDGFTLEAAEAVCADDGLSATAVLDGLGTLVERSLVLAEPGSRYRMLVALRQYAEERLVEPEAIRARHARYFCRLAEQANEERRGSQRGHWLGVLREEYANLRVATAWTLAAGERCVDCDASHRGSDAQPRCLPSSLRSSVQTPAHPHEVALRFAAALCWFWRHTAIGEALAWLRRLLEIPDGPPELLSRALIGAGFLSLRASVDEAEGYFQAALDLAEKQGAGKWQVLALSCLASVSVYRGDRRAVAEFGGQAVALARTHGEPYSLARTLMACALTRGHIGDLDSVAADLDEAQALFRGLGDRFGGTEVEVARAELAWIYADADAVARALGAVEVAGFPPAAVASYWLSHAWLALHEGRYDQVPGHLREGLAAVLDQHEGPYAAQRILGPALDLAAALAAAQDRPVHAAILLHAADVTLTSGGAFAERPQVRWANSLRARLRAILAEDSYAWAAARGRAMSTAEALRYAGLPVPP